jgi:transcriptional regulator with XRE-family HTH domain
MSTQKAGHRPDERITPAQIRGARALLGWSQGQLARAARVGLSTVKDVEIGKRDPIMNNIDAIRRTLEAGGVLFLPANGDGPGVRLRGHRPEIVRRPFQIRATDTLAFLVIWRNTKILVQIPTKILEYIDRMIHRDLNDYLASFRRNEQRILEVTAGIIEMGRFSSPGFVELNKQDFERSAAAPPR